MVTVVAGEIGFPVVVRPSYVLGGRAMAIVYDVATLDRYMTHAVDASPEHPVLVDKFLEDAFEFDVDAVADLVRDQLTVVDDKDLGRATAHSGGFGYVSRHLQVALTAPWLGDTPIGDVRVPSAQIQIRTVLQHAWAEFEHDIRYKGTIPEALAPDRIAGEAVGPAVAAALQVAAHPVAAQEQGAPVVFEFGVVPDHAVPDFGPAVSRVQLQVSGDAAGPDGQGAVTGGVHVAAHGAAAENQAPAFHLDVSIDAAAGDDAGGSGPDPDIGIHRLARDGTGAGEVIGEGLREAFGRRWDRAAIRAYAVEHHSPQVVAARLTQLYGDAIAHDAGR